MKKEIYKGCIEILQKLTRNSRLEDKDVAQLLTNKELYLQVREELVEQNAVRKNGYGGISMNDRTQSLIDSMYFEKLIEEIEKEEYDRDLDNESKRAAIKANTIAKWAIVISVLAATGLPQYLLKLLYKTISKLFC
jgi:hypothetical protein